MGHTGEVHCRQGDSTHRLRDVRVCGFPQESARSSVARVEGGRGRKIIGVVAAEASLGQVSQGLESQAQGISKIGIWAECDMI